MSPNASSGTPKSFKILAQSSSDDGDLNMMSLEMTSTAALTSKWIWAEATPNASAASHADLPICWAMSGPPLADAPALFLHGSRSVSGLKALTNKLVVDLGIDVGKGNVPIHITCAGISFCL